MAIPWTWLTINGAKPLDRTTRNVRAQLAFIETGGEIVRLANGIRRSLRRRQFDKYRFTLSGEAARKPALDAIRKGDTVVLGWPGHIDLPGDVADADLPRAAMPGSILRFGEVDGMPVQLAHGAAGVMVTAFRPILTVIVDDLDVTEDVANASVSWSLTGEER